MIAIRINSNIDDVMKSLDGLQERMAAATASAGAVISNQLAEEVKARIPNQRGWLELYRNSIQFMELNPGAWGVHGQADVQFTQLEAESTLLWFQQGDDVAAILAQYNPWTIDTLPGVVGGVRADCLVRPASQSEVAHHRERLGGLQRTIKALLQRVNKRIDEAEFPKINGRIMADLDFLSRRLEHGLGDFDRAPHWEPAAARLDQISQSAAVKRVVDQALKDGQS